MACTMPPRDDALEELRALALLAPTAIGGPGASEQLARHEGVALLPCDVIEAAAALSRQRKQTGRPVQ